VRGELKRINYPFAGLFCGFSVISLIEIIYFFTLRPYCATKRAKTSANKAWEQQKPTVAGNQRILQAQRSVSATRHRRAALFKLQSELCQIDGELSTALALAEQKR